MRFDSWEYLVLLALVTFLHPRVPARMNWVLLLAASLVCYGYEEPWILGPLLITLLVDFHVARGIADSAEPSVRRRLLLLSLVANLGLLFLFKYLGFALGIVSELLSMAGISWPVATTILALPAGISFYTFQSIAYTVDVYRQRLAPERHFGKFALFVSFFPQLVAGPIERAGRLLPQLGPPVREKLDPGRFAPALDRILWGLFKKMVIADRLAIYVDAVYADPLARDGLSCLIATYFFAFQIYCDFSGYTDIAIGSARLLGVDITENFDRPYFAADVRDFWHRWHITLSTWLRDYVYVPLGGNRHGPSRRYLSLFLTMYLGGLWHGASWTFLLWGTFHGILLVLHHATRPAEPAAPGSMVRAARILVTFHVILVSWILFRAPDVSRAVIVLVKILAAPWRAMPGVRALAEPGVPLDLGIDGALIAALLAGWAVVGSRPVSEWTAGLPLPGRVLVRGVALAGILLLAPGSRHPFLYFQF